MKTILSVSLLITFLALSSCYKKGCTDQAATNYDKHANTGEPCWECDYNGTLLFYFNTITRDSLIARGVTSIAIDVEGQDVGTFPINATTDYSGMCNSTNPMRIDRPGGRPCYGSYNAESYTVKDQNGTVIWEYFTLVNPKYCGTTELSF